MDIEAIIGYVSALAASFFGVVEPRLRRLFRAVLREELDAALDPIDARLQVLEREHTDPPGAPLHVVGESTHEL